MPAKKRQKNYRLEAVKCPTDTASIPPAWEIEEIAVQAVKAAVLLGVAIGQLGASCRAAREWLRGRK